jgi:hypothetical protein
LVFNLSFVLKSVVELQHHLELEGRVCLTLVLVTVKQEGVDGPLVRLLLERFLELSMEST